MGYRYVGVPLKTHEPIDHMAKEDAKVVFTCKKTCPRREQEELSSLCSQEKRSLKKYATLKRCMFDNLRQILEA
jgi:hypothetical protein